mgnify:CR=1 FL=1
MTHMNQNIKMIDEVSILLNELTDKVVFVGGAITSLLLTDPALSDIRPTKNVDVIVEINSYIDYSKLEELLRNKGFKQRVSSQDPLCRWKIGNNIVDFMPTDTKILGFTNLWYSDAINNYYLQKMPGGKTIKIVTPPYFIGTKIEAFLGRGNYDFIMSHDIEDIITVIDGREELTNEIKVSPPDLKQYIQHHLSEFKNNHQFRDAITGYLPTDIYSQNRFSVIVNRIQKICTDQGI